MINRLWSRVDDLMVSVRNQGEVHPLLAGRIVILIAKFEGKTAVEERTATVNSIRYFAGTVRLMMGKGYDVPEIAISLMIRLEELVKDDLIAE
jgi:hypothetical protein